MHLSCKCASKFASEGQLRLQLAPFLRTSRRDKVLVRVSRPRSTRQLSGLFYPSRASLKQRIGRNGDGGRTRSLCLLPRLGPTAGYKRVEMHIALRKRTPSPAAQSNLIWRIHHYVAFCYLFMFLCNWEVQSNLT